MQNSNYLSPLTGPIKRRKFATFDLESKDGESETIPGFTRVFLGGFYDGEHFESFRGPDTIGALMLGMLQTRYLNWHIYAHNGGRFDFLHLLPWLQTEGQALGYRFSIIPSGKSGGIQILDVWRGAKPKKGKWRFLDSIKLIPLSLQKACDTFGLQGKDQLPLETHQDDARWDIYNERDCRALWSVISRYHVLIEENIGGEVGITAPSTAMKTWRRKYLQHSIPRGTDAHEFVFAAYCGGRTEVFQKTGTNLSYYDINSSYPAVMREPMPCSEPIWWYGEPPAVFTQAGSDYVGFVDAEVELDLDIPPLPVKRDGKLMFPSGRVSGRWDWAELSLVKDSIRRYRTSVWFKTAPILKTMVEDLYPLRDPSNPNYNQGLAFCVKNILNSQYGKFGQKPERRKVVPFNEDLPKGAIPVDGSPDSAIWYIDEVVTAPYIMPQIAAHVTALARVVLYRLLLQAGESLCYCDTDSILTSARMDTSTELGELKNEFPGTTFSGNFLAPKLYMLEGSQCIDAKCRKTGGPCSVREHRVKVVAKGLRSRTEDTFRTLQSGGTVSTMELEKLGRMARRGLAAPQMFELKKSIKGGYTKRSWDGNRTKPIIFSDW